MVGYDGVGGWEIGVNSFGVREECCQGHGIDTTAHCEP
jgi:hypothetical protein